MNIIDEYKNYISSQKSCWYTTEQTEEGNFLLTSKYATAEVNFYDFDISTCELKITNCKEKGIFYLHFELKNIEHAQGLFDEMLESFHKVKKARRIEVLLSCSSGLTTSYFAEALNKAAEVLALDMHFSAESYTELYPASQDKDVVLLAPQIGYLYKQAKEILVDKVIIQIPTTIFGSYDTNQMIQLVQKELDQTKALANKKAINNKTKDSYGKYMVILTIDTRQPTIKYRIYDECTVIEEGEVLKDRWHLSDYEDLLDTVLPRHPEVENVYISTPGLINDGKFTFNYQGIINFDLIHKFEAKYERNFALSNNHNALTRGYYEDHKTEYKDFILYSSTKLNHAGGAGVILNGELFHGRHDLAGEIHYMLKAIHYSDPYHDLAKTPEGQAELCAKVMVPLILSFSPETMGIYNPMITDLTELKRIITKYIPAELQPEIIKVEDYEENTYWGAILMGKEEIDQRRLNSKEEIKS